ncbi:hypothetical protein FN960_01390 [Alkalicoccobacillus porphyridii]|uniref:Uncharacterized protein n=1 Tax=Alkalicoccobacillus porphyridii TaxID=2597270 RepID=A0A554A3G2_9BACI|nr:hypothetical protein FN960_01390 [Alkalicoccobacillus porphyridii]
MIKPKVLVLGTFHMHEGLDSISQKTDSGHSLLPEAESEIALLVERMAAFKPNKVSVEVEVKRQVEIDKAYQQYLHNDDWKLPINEIHQIGFRLARAMELEKVYASIGWISFQSRNRSVMY